MAGGHNSDRPNEPLVLKSLGGSRAIELWAVGFWVEVKLFRVGDRPTVINCLLGVLSAWLTLYS